MRVVYMTHVARLSGAELALVRLLGALDGVDAHVILAESGPLIDSLEAVGAHTEVIPFSEAARGLGRDRVSLRLPAGSVLATASYVRTLRTRLRELRPDIVHTNSLKAGVYGGLAARAARIPVVWQVHDRIAPDYLPGPAVHAVRTALRVIPDAVMPNSRTTLATLGSGRALRRHQITAVVPPAVAAPLIDRAHAPGHPFRIGMLGRLAPWKGQDVFVDAFAQAFPTGDTQAAIIGAPLFGEEQYARELAARVLSLGVQDRVEFRGFRDDLGPELARIDVLVHASRLPEPFGQVVVEGMAAGLPVVAAAAGGPTEIVTDGVDGLLVRPDDPPALARALRRLEADPSWRARLAEAGPVTARRYAPEVVAPQVRDIYERIRRRSP